MIKLALVLLAGASVMAIAETASFDDQPAGQTPAGWVAGVTGKGTFKWTVEPAADAPSKPNVLKQSENGKYPYCVKKDVNIKDGFVEVKFKPVAGEFDQAAGIVWRFKDGDNYYITRANALEGNVTIYHVAKGTRTAFKNVVMPVAFNVWHTLRVEYKGSAFVVSLDGKTVIEATDDTFKDAGAVGLWTKADSVTLFDDFQYGGL